MKVLSARDAAHGVAVVAVVVIDVDVTIVEVEVHRILRIVFIQRARPNVAVVSDVVDIIFVAIASGSSVSTCLIAI